LPQNTIQIPSPDEAIRHPVFERAGLEVRVKRDDLIHPQISGNKWRKLKYNLLAYAENGREAVLTFGGAYSNHLLATAAAGAMHGIPTIGLVRGSYADVNNPTLSAARELGMHLHPIDKETWDLRTADGFNAWLHEHYGNVHVVAEGGANYYGVAGAAEILREVAWPYDVVVCGLGTGTTVAGILSALPDGVAVYAVQVLKADPLYADVRRLLWQTTGDEELAYALMAPLHIETRYHGGGYAKRDVTLEQFMRSFYHETGLMTDPVYTGKVFRAVVEEAAAGRWPTGTRILTIHTGGLQGITGYEQRYGVKIFSE
jgi:1-aminocyclopropane-1-carboxylate deaminase/D-cysteine desulfhydrase-like pyridoxal-dependent ACC family enzyme